MKLPEQTPEQKANSEAATTWAIGVMRSMPKDSPDEFEAHMTAILIVFWGALWGTFGTEFAQGFIEAQLRSMKSSSVDVFTPPTEH